MEYFKEMPSSDTHHPLSWSASQVGASPLLPPIAAGLLEISEEEYFRGGVQSEVEEIKCGQMTGRACLTNRLSTNETAIASPITPQTCSASLPVSLGLRDPCKHSDH